MLASITRSGTVTKGTECTVVDIYPHPNYACTNCASNSNDVALLRIDCADDTINTDIEPITLPDASTDDYLQRTADVKLRAIGMGRKNHAYYFKYADKLQQVDLFTTSLNECAKSYRDSVMAEFEKDIQVQCSSYTNNGAACKDDANDVSNMSHDNDIDNDDIKTMMSWDFARICCYVTKKLSALKFIDASMMCAHGGSGYKQSPTVSNGDSGGPLVWRDTASGKYILYGVASFVSKLNSNAPAVFHYVPSSLDWIRATTAIGSNKSKPYTLVYGWLVVVVLIVLACVFFAIGYCLYSQRVGKIGNKIRCSSTDTRREHAAVSIPIIHNAVEKTKLNWRNNMPAIETV